MGWYAEHEAFHEAEAKPECRPFCHMVDMTHAIPREVVCMAPNRALLYLVLKALCPQLAVKPAEADMLWLAAHADEATDLGQTDLVAPAQRGLLAEWDPLEFQTGWDPKRLAALKVASRWFLHGPKHFYDYQTPSLALALMRFDADITPRMRKEVAKLHMEVTHGFEGTKGFEVIDASDVLGKEVPTGSIFAWAQALPRKTAYIDFKTKFVNLMALIPPARHLTFDSLALGSEPMAFLRHVDPECYDAMMDEGLTPRTYAHYMTVLDFLRAESLARLKLFAKKAARAPLTVVYPSGTRQRLLVGKHATLTSLANTLKTYRSPRTGRTEWDGPYVMRTFCGVKVDENTHLGKMPRNICLYATRLRRSGRARGACGKR